MAISDHQIRIRLIYVALFVALVAALLVWCAAR